MKLLKYAICLLIGGLSFWGPTVAIELITRRELSLAVGTLLPFASVLAAYLLVGHGAGPLHARWTPLTMLAGVYVAGPTMMSIGWMYLGGSTQIDVRNLIVASLFPLFTLYMAGPDVTVFGVLLATAALILLQLRIRPNMQSIRPTDPLATKPPRNPEPPPAARGTASTTPS